MYPTASSPQYAFGSGLAPVPMPVYKRGGEVKETYGLENAAEMIRRRGREGDTVLAHISPQEAGILKLLGGSGTINPYTGLPEFKKWYKYITDPVQDLGRKIDDELLQPIKKGLDTGIEGIAKALGPVGSIAAAYFGGPIGAAIYQGFAAPGEDFDFKNAAKAAALTYAAGELQGIGGGAEAGAGAGAGADLATQQAIDAGIDIVSAPSMYPSVSQAVSMSGPGAFEGAYSDAASSPLSYDGSGIGEPVGQYASAGTTATDAYPTAPTAPTTPAVDPYAVDNVGNVSESRVMGDYGYGSAPVETYNLPRTEDGSGIRGLDTSGENYLSAAGSLGEATAEAAYGLASRNPLTTLSLGATAYGAYKTKQELEDAKREADRILADRANRKKEEIEWAQSVMRDYPYNYRRLTEEEVRSERGMAMGGRINSYDDEIGGDDSMMQGGIAALAKGGLPPRYLRGGGDGMSDSIRASIEGKQEARLADGEFVVPADVVSHLGNGSSNAGAKKLYSMMDRVRRSRTGKTRQAPEVNTRRLMPA
jgi:hypothetical protein